MRPSATTLATNRARDAARTRPGVITLTFGEPDFDTPDNIKQAAIDALRRGETKYTPVAGIAPLKTAVVDKFRRENGLEYRADEVIVGVGAKQLVFNAFLATVDPGDEVIVPTPFWPSYPEMVALAGGRVVHVAARAEHEFRLVPDDLEAAITPRTKWLVLTTPSNPSGAVYTRTQLEGLGRVLRRHPHVHVLADNIYEQLVFDGRPFVTPAALDPLLKERTLTVNGVSKGHAMTGWRIGFAGGPAELVGALEALQSQQTSGACSIAQWATVEALSNSQPFLDETRAIFEQRRDLVVTMLNDTEHLRCHRPEGSFYVFPSLTGAIGLTTSDGVRIATDEDFVDALLGSAGVGAVAGTAFGCSPHFRLSFAASTPVLTEACARIQRFCAALR